MKTYEDFVTEAVKDWRSAKAHLMAHRQMIELAASLVDPWTSGRENRTADITYARGITTIDSASLNLYLAEEDSIAYDVALFLDEHLNNRSDLSVGNEVEGLALSCRRAERIAANTFCSSLV